MDTINAIQLLSRSLYSPPHALKIISMHSGAAALTMKTEFDINLHFAPQQWLYLASIVCVLGKMKDPPGTVNGVDEVNSDSLPRLMKCNIFQIIS